MAILKRACAPRRSPGRGDVEAFRPVFRRSAVVSFRRDAGVGRIPAKRDRTPTTLLSVKRAFWTVLTWECGLADLNAG